MPATNKLPTVLLIMSASRSGSTILCNLLGQADGAFGAGELHRLWDAEALGGRMCSCGELVLRCPLWRPILQACHGSAELSDLLPVFTEIQRHRDACARTRHMPQIAPYLSPALKRHRQAYLQALESMYAAIQQVTGCRVVVDASKLPAYASVLLDSQRLDARVLFLTRDARATAFSWRRRKSTVVRGRAFVTAQYSALTSAKEWLITNWAAGRLARAIAPDRLLHMRYEDVMADPAQSLRRIAQLADLADDSLPLRAPNQAELSAAHLLAGNQNRFQTGLITLRPDDEWRKAMTRADYRLVTALTWPLLRRYGYAK